MYDDAQYRADQNLWIPRNTWGAQKTTAADQTVAAAGNQGKMKFYQTIKLRNIKALMDNAASSAGQAKGDHTYTIKLTDGTTDYGKVVVSTGTAADLIDGTVTTPSIPKATALTPKLVITKDAGDTKGTHTGPACYLLLGYQERWA